MLYDISVLLHEYGILCWRTYTNSSRILTQLYSIILPASPRAPKSSVPGPGTTTRLRLSNEGKSSCCHEKRILTPFLRLKKTCCWGIAHSYLGAEIHLQSTMRC